MATPPEFDLVGVGFGPSNLALAIAVAEHNGTSAAPVTAQFLERQPAFGWHRGMLLDDATMQVSFLKDLVTMRNPASRFSFLSYLHEHGRLVDFINHKTFFPLRVEFHDYLEWAAAKVSGQVAYGSEAVSVRSTGDCFEVRTGHGEVRRARNLVFGTGLRPNVPAGIEPSDRVWHNADLLRRIGSVRAPGRCVVIGAGQSAAETTAFLHERFPDAEICSVFARYGYSPSDDSSFANRIFDPEGVDAYYSAPEDVKQRLMDYHGNTNYSAVDVELIDDLYRRVYRETVKGRQRLRIFNMSRPVEIVEDERVRVTVESLATGEKTVLDADLLVCATGYRPADPSDLLGELGAQCRRDEHGRLRVERDYRLVAPDLPGAIYVQGGTEHTHGITSSLLSNTAVRVGEILASILDRRPSTEWDPEYAVKELA
ncbi:L-lysine 6-monooxygenase [Amycolatopsis sp. AA4]|uniref:lysine N(6)-hydroxylase/L-ornithine N(5)-oxygenase family protein n=1 Tax=Actinomycetes TaxID=1760 RepID=UPI0001B57001|nr:MULTISPECIES: lysine N(6)-hydroxylase/L-ornithine N(5)-oxygenase family protein [Actinomycetes]ATY11283.1 L-lysine 6-monooxygenase [Amycolatopsis sp. AA4]EFL06875.1 peptide monooxygenase [Streptomyces sp. AA4]